MNLLAVDRVNEALVKIDIPDSLPEKFAPDKKLVPDDASDFVKRVIEPVMREKGDQIKVSDMPLDGVIETGTANWKKEELHL